MTVRHMRLTLGLFFLVAGVALLVLRFAAPEAVAGFNLDRLLLGAILALVLAGVNLARWYAGLLWFHRQATPVRTPLQPNPRASNEPEYNSEFDFEKKDRM